MNRTRLFGGVGVIVVLNALAGRMITSLAKGFWPALSEAFGVSAIVWLALILMGAVILAVPATNPAPCDERVRPIDAIVAASLVLFVTLTASPMLAAGALVPFAVWGALEAPRGSNRWRAALIMLALTLTLLWGPFVLRFIPELLQVDAHLAAWLIGGTVDGNIYASPDGLKRYIVGSGCSSLNNISMATIFAVSLTLYFERPVDRKIGWAILLASLLTIAVNIARLALIALKPAEFEYWHNGQGGVIFGWIALVAIVLVVGFAIDRKPLRAPR